MNKYIKHFVLVCKHKFYVGKECFKMKLYWQGITHDLSKFSSIEFFESAKFFTGKGSPIDEAKKIYGYSKAWLHHAGRNKHHWQYWIDYKDGKAIPINIPLKYIKEMACDIIGASKSYKTNNYFDYYEKHSPNWIITDKTRSELEKILNYKNTSAN